MSARIVAGGFGALGRVSIGKALTRVSAALDRYRGAHVGLWSSNHCLAYAATVWSARPHDTGRPVLGSKRSYAFAADTRSLRYPSAEVLLGNERVKIFPPTFHRRNHGRAVRLLLTCLRRSWIPQMSTFGPGRCLGANAVAPAGRLVAVGFPVMVLRQTTKPAGVSSKNPQNGVQKRLFVIFTRYLTKKYHLRQAGSTAQIACI